MALTNAEKQRFVTRLANRVTAIKDTIAGENPTLKRDLTAQAQKITEGIFGIGEIQAEFEKVQLRERKLMRKKRKLIRQMVEQVRGRAAADAGHYSNSVYYRTSGEDNDFQRYPNEIRDYMRDQCTYERRRLEDSSPVGRSLKALDEQQEAFIDAITVCATHSQLETLWSKICAELGILDAEAERQPRKVSTARKEKVSSG